MSANPPDLSRETYTQRVARRFRADVFARTGLWVVIILFLLATLAPFLANSHALLRVAQGRVAFPIFLSLEPDRMALPDLRVFGRIGLSIPSSLARQVRLSLVGILCLIALVETGLAFSHPVNDPTNDRDRPASFKLMPPIPYSPIETSPDQFVPPSWKHLCGTDSTGRDIAARMLHGARTSLSIGFVSQGIALFIGISLGGLAGYYRGWTDIAVCRFIEIMDCFPPLLLILVAIGIFESQNNMFYIMAVIGLTGWTGVARLVRGEFLRLSVQPFTLAAQAIGANDFRIIVRHLLPNR